MKQYPVITISRQFGSGGRKIGQALSKKLGISYYDNELITMAAEESGFAPELFKNADQNASNSLLFSLSMYGSTNGTFSLPLGDQVFIIQSDIIKKVAEQGPCIIVGRCADHILRDHSNCLSVFLHAPIEYRVKRSTVNYGLSADKAKETIIKTDKKRSVYYSHFTGEKWGTAENYHITVDTSRAGIEGTVAMLAAVAENLVKL